MEAALTWQFGVVHHRLPTGRAPSFTQPLVRSGSAPRQHRHRGTCALPTASRLGAIPPAAIGWRVDDWAHHSAHYMVNARGQRLFVQTWRPLRTPPSLISRLLPWRRAPTSARGVVHIVHGLNDHSNKYTHVARRWVEAGFAVVAHDFHGHGRSDGYRAYTSSMQHYVDDARQAVMDSERRLPSHMARLPKFLLAHSLGGAVAIHLARDSLPGAFNGVMLTAPAVKVYPKPILKLFAPVLATLAPLLPVQRLKFDRRRRTKGEYSQLEDPLVVRSPVRARVGYEVLKSCDKIMSEADRFRVPLFVAHSRQDRVTNAKGSVDFVARIGSNDKTVRLYEGGVHDLLADRRDAVVADMVSWAEQRLR